MWIRESDGRPTRAILCFMFFLSEKTETVSSDNVVTEVYLQDERLAVVLQYIKTWTDPCIFLVFVCILSDIEIQEKTMHLEQRDGFYLTD